MKETRTQIQSEDDLTFENQRFYSPRITLDRSLYPNGKKIPVVELVNTNIYANQSKVVSHNSVLNSIDHLTSSSIPSNPNQVPIDSWVPGPEDKVFTHIRGAIIAPVHRIFAMAEDNKANNMIDYFYVTAKRCYNSDTKMKDGRLSIGFRDHCTNYMNYFVKFYDKEMQLLGLYANIKYMMDCQIENYSFNAFLHDLWKYFINPNGSYQAQYLNYQIDKMNIEQYNLELNYKNNKSPVLEYTDYHAKIMLKISVMQNMMIPLLTHFILKKKIPADQIKNVLMRSFDLLLQASKMIYNIDLVSKICETTFSNVSKNTNSNSVLWDMQNIRGRNATTHSMETVENIIMQIIPKYTYDKNIIHFNYNAINRDIKFRVTDVPYEYSFVVLSSSVRDDDNNSECDKFEAHAAKLNEAILVQTLVNCSTTMKRIEIKYGPFDENEIKFYYHELSKNGKMVVNSLQKTLITYLFAKEFDDPQSAKIVNIREYIILIIAARRLLESFRLFQLPYMIGGKVNRIVTRKNINKKELQKIESSEFYPLIHDKYNNVKIEQEVILSLIAQILSSEFQTIDYLHPENNGLTIHVVPDIVSEEICRFVMLI
jgi:hypothetical protein